MLQAFQLYALQCSASHAVSSKKRSIPVLYTLHRCKHSRFQAFALMSYFNSCVNPIVYAFMSKNFRDSFRQVFKVRVRLFTSPCTSTYSSRFPLFCLGVHTRAHSLRILMPVSFGVANGCACSFASTRRASKPEQRCKVILNIQIHLHRRNANCKFIFTRKETFFVFWSSWDSPCVHVFPFDPPS